MKNLSSTERILNHFGWKTTNGKVEYRGFEYTLNADLPNWKTSEPIEEYIPIVEEEELEVKPIYLNPKMVEYRKRTKELHTKLISKQQQVDILKKIKDKIDRSKNDTGRSKSVQKSS